MYGSSFEAATKLQPKLDFDDLSPSLIGQDAVTFDVVESSSPQVADQSAGVQSLIIDQAMKFVEAYRSKTKTSQYPTGEDQDLAVARCLIMDDRYSDLKLIEARTRQSILQRWNEWHHCYINSSRIRTGKTVEYASPDSEANIRAELFQNRILEHSRGIA